MTGRLGVWFMRVLAHLPLPVLRGMGWLLGQVAFVLVAPRRKVALRNEGATEGGGRGPMWKQIQEGLAGADGNDG